MKLHFDKNRFHRLIQFHSSNHLTGRFRCTVASPALNPALVGFSYFVNKSPHSDLTFLRQHAADARPHSSHGRFRRQNTLRRTQASFAVCFFPGGKEQNNKYNICLKIAEGV